MFRLTATRFLSRLFLTTTSLLVWDGAASAQLIDRTQAPNAAGAATRRWHAPD